MPDIMLVVTLLTSGNLMQSERQDLSIYRAMGLPCTALRRSFSLRFLLVSLVGSDRLARCGHGPDGADADVWHEQLQLPDGVGRHRFAGGRDCTAVHRFCLPGLRKDQTCAAYRTDAGAIDFEGSGAHSPRPWARKDRGRHAWRRHQNAGVQWPLCLFFRPFHGLFPPVIGLARIQRVSRGPFLQAAFIAFIY